MCNEQLPQNMLVNLKKSRFQHFDDIGDDYYNDINNDDIGNDDYDNINDDDIGDGDYDRLS